MADLQISNLSRRDFLVAGTAGGLVLGIGAIAASREATATSAVTETALGVYVTIATDGTITLVTPDAEMGQGTYTTLPALIAEELDVDLQRVRIELSGENIALINPMKKYQSSGQSMAVRGYYLPLRKVGAAARQMLVVAAAARWSVAYAECDTADGTVVHRPTGRVLGYGEVAADAAKLKVPDDPVLKSPAQFRILGRTQRRKDAPAKVDGSAVFGCDTPLPGLLHACVRAAPDLGGTLKSVDESAIAGRRGIRAVVRLPNAVAVVADNWWRAKQALADLPVEFAPGPHAAMTSDSHAAELGTALGAPGLPGPRHGDVDAALAAGPVLTLTYQVPHLAHATMEPMSCTAWVRDGRCDIWAPSQTPGMAREAAARALGMPVEHVRLERTFLGGGFGRRFQNDFVQQSALISRAVAAPVRMLWSREEDTTHDFYRPAFMARYDAVLADGRLHAVRARVAGPSIFGFSRPGAMQGADPSLTMTILDEGLAVPHIAIEHCSTGTQVPIGVWRAVSHSQNGFFKDCFLDEVAHALGRDPFDLRLALVPQPRVQAVLRELRQRSGWDAKPRPGVGRGMAIVEGYGSVCGQVIEVEQRGDALRVARVVAVVDCGLPLDPGNVAAQVEGNVVYGLTAALWGEITFAGGAAQQRNFDTYRMLRLPEMPRVETHLMPSIASPGGIGEPPLAPVAPALANAIFALTGVRHRQLPLSKAGLTFV